MVMPSGRARQAAGLGDRVFSRWRSRYYTIHPCVHFSKSFLILNGDRCSSSSLAAIALFEFMRSDIWTTIINRIIFNMNEILYRTKWWKDDERQ